MRSYVTFRPTFWVRGSGKKLRGNPEAQVLAMYLVTCGHGTVCGIFHAALPTIAHETGLPLERLPVLLGSVSEIAQYDLEEELCWIPNSAREQIGETMSLGDKRRRALEVELKQFGHHRFVRAFVTLYSEPYTLETMKGLPELSEGASEVPGASAEAPSTAQHSTETALDQVEGVQGEAAPSSPPSSPVRPPQGLDDALRIPVVERARLLTKDPHKATYLQPQCWPEVVDLAKRWCEAMKWHAADFQGPTKSVMKLVELLATFDTEALNRAIAASPTDKWLNEDRKSLASLTVDVVTTLLSPDKARASPVRGRVPQENAGKTGFEGAKVIS